LVLLALLAGCERAPEAPRRTHSVRLLPDAPPPPPPPPRPEDKPPPKPQDKPQPPDAPKPVETPQAQALKSDEAAGNGPGNGLAAGAVTQDYSDQRLGTGTTLGGSGDAGASRLAANAYAQATTRALNAFLAADKAVKRHDYQVRVDLWLSASGGVLRAELGDSTGDADTDQALRSALARFPGSASPPPPRLPQPLRLRVSNRLMG
jgi:protein TonB